MTRKVNVSDVTVVTTGFDRTKVERIISEVADKLGIDMETAMMLGGNDPIRN